MVFWVSWSFYITLILYIFFLLFCWPSYVHKFSLLFLCRWSSSDLSSSQTSQPPLQFLLLSPLPFSILAFTFSLSVVGLHSPLILSVEASTVIKSLKDFFLRVFNRIKWQKSSTYPKYENGTTCGYEFDARADFIQVP